MPTIIEHLYIEKDPAQYEGKAVIKAPESLLLQL